MWIWIVSLVVLIACFLFAWRMMVSSYDLIPTDKKFSMFKSYSNSENSFQMETIRVLKSRLKSLEDQNSYYEVQFSRLQQRMKVLEGEKMAAPVPQLVHLQDDEEDWKELYYEENEKKAKLENQLDETEQELEALKLKLQNADNSTDEINTLKSELEARLKEIQSLKSQLGDARNQLEGLKLKLQKANSSPDEIGTLTSELEVKLKEIQSLKSQLGDVRRQLRDYQLKLEESNSHTQEIDALRSQYDARLIEIQSLQNHAGEVQQQLEAARQRERDLEVKLQEEINHDQKYVKVSSQQKQLQDENEDLRRQIVELAHREEENRNKLARLHELESRVAIFEEEKSKMIAGLEDMVNQSRMMSGHKNE